MEINNYTAKILKIIFDRYLKCDKFKEYIDYMVDHYFNDDASMNIFSNQSFFEYVYNILIVDDCMFDELVKEDRENELKSFEYLTKVINLFKYNFSESASDLYIEDLIFEELFLTNFGNFIFDDVNIESNILGRVFLDGTEYNIYKDYGVENIEIKLIKRYE